MGVGQRLGGVFGGVALDRPACARLRGMGHPPPQLRALDTPIRTLQAWAGPADPGSLGPCCPGCGTLADASSLRSLPCCQAFLLRSCWLSVGGFVSLSLFFFD